MATFSPFQAVINALNKFSSGLDTGNQQNRGVPSAPLGGGDQNRGTPVTPPGGGNDQNRGVPTTPVSIPSSSGGGSSSGSSGGSSYGGGGGTSYTPTPVPVTPVTPAPPPITQDVVGAPTTPVKAQTGQDPTGQIKIPDPLADATYMQQKGELAKQLADYQANQGLQSNQYGAGYNTGLHKLGWDPTGGGKWNQADTTGSYGSAFDNNLNDYAGRGLGWSGLFAKSVGDMNTDFTQRKTDLDTGLKDFKDTQTQALNNYTSQNQASDARALQDAISRIAAQYGVGLNQVIPGAKNNMVAKAA